MPEIENDVGPQQRPRRCSHVLFDHAPRDVDLNVALDVKVSAAPQIVKKRASWT